MPIDLDFNRLKSVITNPTTATITAGTIQEFPAVGATAEEAQFFPFNHGSITPSTFTVAACSLTSSSAIITTTTANGFANVRVGDAVTVSGGTGTLPATTVTAINSSTSITISANATTSGTAVLQFAPPAISPAVWGIRLLYQKSGSVITIRPTLYLYDGSLGSTVGTPTNATTAINLTDSQGNVPSIDLDAFYNGVRLARGT